MPLSFGCMLHPSVRNVYPAPPFHNFPPLDAGMRTQHPRFLYHETVRYKMSEKVLREGSLQPE